MPGESAPAKQEEVSESAAVAEEGGPARNGTGPGPGPGPERQPAAGLPRQSRSLELPPQNSEHGPHTLPRQKSARLKVLMRSHAMREETSPPPEADLPPAPPPPPPPPPRYSLSVSHGHKLRKFHSQGSAEGRAGSPHLSAESSGEVYMDSKGVDVEQFLVEALNANIKDQAHLLKYEQDMLHFIKDNGRAEFKFPPQSSYQRMLVHRAAVYFGLDHNVDPTGTSVIVTKTERTRIPELRFRDLLRDDGDEPKRLLKRDGLLGHYSRSFDNPNCLDSRRSRSFEEREVEYRKARTRIFNNQQQELDGEWAVDGRGGWLDAPPDALRRQMPSKAHSVDQPPRYARLNNADSLDTGANSLRVAGAGMRPPGVSKSHSFGGYTGAAALSRGDSAASAGSARLAKQDSSASSVSRLSPSSGYKTASVSQVTLDSTPSPTSQHQTGYSLEDGGGAAAAVPGPVRDCQPVLWAVSNLEDVPAGSVIIDPHSGQPYLNPDRTVYRYNPANPPQLVPAAASPPALPAPAPAAAYHAASPPAAAVRFVSPGTDGAPPPAPLQYVPAGGLQYVAPGASPPAPAVQYVPQPGPAPGVAGYYPVVPPLAAAAAAAGQPRLHALHQSQPSAEKPTADVSHQLMGLTLAEHGQGDAQLAAQQQYLLAYRTAAGGQQPGQQPPQQPTAAQQQQQQQQSVQQQQQQQMFCLPGPAVPLRYMYHQLVSPDQAQPQTAYMGVYPGGTTMSSAPAAEASYYVTSPPAAGPPVYPLAPFYGQQTYPAPAGRTASDPTAVSQQVLGYPTAQYPALVSAGPPVAGRLVGGPRLRSAESCDDSLLVHPHPLAAPAPAYQRHMPLNVRLVTPLRQPPQPQSAAGRPGRARRSRARSKASSEGTVTPNGADTGGGCVLEVEGVWPGLRRCELERLLEEPVVSAGGGRLQFGPGSPPPDAPLPAHQRVQAVFETAVGADAAILALKPGRLRLRRPDC